MQNMLFLSISIPTLYVRFYITSVCFWNLLCTTCTFVLDMKMYNGIRLHTIAKRRRLQHSQLLLFFYHHNYQGASRHISSLADSHWKFIRVLVYTSCILVVRVMVEWILISTGLLYCSEIYRICPVLKRFWIWCI